MKKIFLILFAVSFQLSAFSVFAADNDKVITLNKQIIDAKSADTLYAPFEELSSIYFSGNKYPEFMDFLSSLKPKNKVAEPFVNYYIALTRYDQLKYLEESKAWDEYFAKGNNYRDDLTSGLKSAIEQTSTTDALNIYSKLLLWQFHKDQQDSFSDDSLSSLMDSVLEYSKTAKDIEPIKVSADKLSAYEEKGKSRELYKAYAVKMATSDIKDEDLLKSAANFYKQGNFELSETLYDDYIARISVSLPKEKLLPVLQTLAKSFAYNDQGNYDMFYAEKIFKKIEEIGGKEVFDLESIYLRAFNLEKAKDFSAAKDIYLDLISRFPGSIYNDQAIYKVGVICAYVQADIKSAKEYFEKLGQKEKDLSTQAISGLYQLGLLSHWEGNFAKAKEYYDKIINIPSADAWDTQALVRQRLKEIDEEKPIEYNLKTFMDISLKGENGPYGMGKSELKASAYKLKKGQDVTFTSTAALPDSGCMQVELQYLWSGHLGSTNPPLMHSGFTTSYASTGSKEINLIVISPAGIIDRNIDFVDVY
jgi:TolA-binding protein